MTGRDSKVGSATFAVSLQWEPANVGLTGNKEQTCKNRQSGSADTEPCHFLTLLHSWFNGDWKKENLNPIWRLERAQQTIIFRLFTGHL